MLPSLVPLDAVDGGQVDTKLLGNLGHGLIPSSQLAPNLQHLGLRQHRHPTLSLAARPTRLTLRLGLLYGCCTYNFLASGQGDGLLGLGQIKFNVLARIKSKTSIVERFDDLSELRFRKDVHVHRLERVQCSREEVGAVNS